MKTNLFCFLFLLGAGAAHAAIGVATNSPGSILWNEIGAKAGADYKGAGLAVIPSESGACLHCVFQRLDGEATPEGLWLTSTLTNAPTDRFRVTAVEVERVTPNAASDSTIELPRAGNVFVEGETARFSRPGLTEEYSVSMDGVRQDFIVEQSTIGPPGGQLVVKLAVTGAKVEAAAYGARLVLENSGRKIAYSRLHVTDANGKELPAHIEVCSIEDGDFFEGMSFLTPAETDSKLAVVVNDAGAVYPVRIDPTFSDANWVSMGSVPGADAAVYAAAADSSGNLYIGGNFTVAGDSLASYVAQWNGHSWAPLGSGISGKGGDGFGPFVMSLTVSGDILYVGGDFSIAGGISANSVAQWNGTNWSSLGLGLNKSVQALMVSGGTLYAGGNFTTAGGGAANYIAQWNGTNWSPMGSGMNGEVRAVAALGSTIYAGGFLTAAGGNSAEYIAQWNGTAWSPVGSGMNSYVYALAVSGNTLYAGGFFTNAGGSRANYIAQWNGTTWSALGSGMNAGVTALAVSGSTLYVGGQFTNAGGSAANYTAQWNGSVWSAMGPGMNSDVYALAISGNAVYAGGFFTTAGSSGADYVAQWNGSSWSGLGSGMDNQVLALAVSGNTLYAGGVFTTAGGGVPANYIAQWNGSSWSALGSGISGKGGDGFGPQVNALAVSGDTLYVGGDFSTAGGIASNSIAQWNGSSWSALGSGVAGPIFSTVNALLVSGGTLYAGGEFTNIGGVFANYIAQWNGANWSPLGPGMNGGVNALVVSGSTLYAGGYFSAAGNGTANNVAQWNGTTWSSVGTGMSTGVNALALSGGSLYAGGYFTTAGGGAANNIAQWNGTNWSPLGLGVNNFVYTLLASGGVLYVGGQFTDAGGIAANYIAQWDGTNWSPLGSGMNNGVNALLLSGGTMYLGGEFTTAGTNVSAYIAEALLSGPPVSPAIITTNAAFGFTNGVFGFDVSGPAGTNVVIEASTNLQTWVPLQTNLVVSGLFYFSDSQSPADRQRFYRAVLFP